ncbi:RNA polymerase sigma factor [Dehalococcoidia bacterium]|nr:RNA polymerase sigma factor [Dehalococcoidia bacterium]
MTSKRKKFSKIFDKYIDKIYRFIFLKVSSQEIAQDLCSETFLRGWKKYRTTNNKIENIQAFLYQIARNLVIDHYRERGRTQIVPPESVVIIDQKQNLEQNAMLTSEVNRIKKALANLKDDYQNVIIWHYLDDLSISETAKLLDRTEEATRVLLHRALKTLREQLTMNNEQ